MRVLIYILGGFLLFRVLGRLLSPWLVRKAKEKMQEQAHAQRSARDQHFDQRQEGDIKVEIPTRPNAKRNSSKAADDGDYIDFEEIKE